MNREFYEKIMTDKAFRAEFMSAPTEVFKKYSIDMYGDKNIEVHENTKTKMHYALLPEGTDLEDLNVPEEFKKIQKKAWEDKTYLEMLLKEPKNAVTQIMGSIPESLEIRFYAHEPTTAHVILPALEEETDELSDDDLEMVAGGKGNANVEKAANGAKDFVNGAWNAYKDVAGEGFRRGKEFASDVFDAGKKLFSGW